MKFETTMKEADEKLLRVYLSTLAMAAVAGGKGDLALATDDVIRFIGKLAAAAATAPSVANDLDQKFGRRK